MPVVITLAEPDDRWPVHYASEADSIARAVGSVALRIDHVGSTSVPGLAAKPILDILLVVPDSADEAAFVPALEQAGYTFALREPDWHEHRLLRRTGPAANLHVFTVGSSEVDRMLLFRDRLREHAGDRTRYEEVKRRLAAQPWESVQHYADAKSEVVEEILARAAQD
jgi:GrpB-like predicted nucleotidyltransferase (UPF0157 family)